MLLIALANACWRTSPVTLCPLAPPPVRAAVVETSACPLLALLVPPLPLELALAVGVGVVLGTGRGWWEVEEDVVTIDGGR